MDSCYWEVPVLSLSVTHQASLAARWWAVPPLGRVSQLTGVGPGLVPLVIDALPAEAPAIVSFRPPSGRSLADQIDLVLDELDRAALALFPYWLPGAPCLDGSTNLALAAVRALAAEAAADGPGFGPFLVELAERAMPGPFPVRRQRRSRFAREVRAAGLGRAMANAYGKADLVVLVAVPEGLSAGDEQVLVGAAEWLVHHGRLTVWLTGPPLRSVDRVREVSISLPEYLVTLAAEVPHALSPDDPEHERGGRPAVEPGTRSATRPTASLQTAPLLGYPPLSGVPRPDSAAEQALERGLSPHAWADGRCWNRTFEWHTLARAYRLDLFWPDDGLVVEVDGPEHRERLKYADDRHRDAQLQVLGFDVLRFTNEQVLYDVQATIATIRNLLLGRRRHLLHHAVPPDETRNRG